MRHATPLLMVCFGLLMAGGIALHVGAAPTSRPSTRPTPTAPTTSELRLSDCPKPVQRKLKAEAHGARIDSVEIDPGSEGEEDYYVATVEIGRHTYEITVAADGQLIEKYMTNDSEQTVKLDDCPKAVRDALVDEAAGAKIDEVERDVRHGAVTFTAGIQTDDGYYWIVVARDGTLLDKYLDDSDDDPGPQSDDHHPQQV